MELNVWISAFIPLDVKGVTQPRMGHANQSIVEAPWPFECFLTDHRSFSSNIDETARLKSVLTLNLASLEHSIVHSYAGSTHVDCETGTLKSYKGPAAKSRQQSSGRFGEYFRGRATGRFEPTFFHQFQIVASHKNTLTPPGSPYIDYNCRISVAMCPVCTVNGDDSIDVSVELDGSVDEFPAFESYASLNGHIQTLFTRMPDEGKTPFDLYGGAINAVDGEASFLIGNAFGEG